MTERDKTQSLRGVEVLIILLMYLFLLAVVPLACRRSKSGDDRMRCAANLSGLGKAMLIYSNNYEEKLPRSGGRNTTWAHKIPNWKASNRYVAYNISPNGEGGFGSISSCFYLLVKYVGLTPKSFVCPQDHGTTEFKPAAYGAGNRDMIDLWDFGNDPSLHCSYSYHLPFSLYALKTSNEAGMPMAADRNPYIPSPMAGSKDISLFHPEGSREAIKAGNAVQHDEEGQNVLFLDTHVAFERTPCCGIEDDNIYTYWDGGDIRRGAQPSFGRQPWDRVDSYLVHDAPTDSFSQHSPPPKGRACFLPETLVWIDDMLLPISKVVAGQVLCRSLGTTPGPWLDRVEMVQKHTGTFECRDIVLESGNHIGVVGAHCFMLDSGRWFAAQDLTSGLRLRTCDGTILIKSIITTVVPYTGKVYNLKVKNSEMYMVGKDAVIVRDY